MNTDAESTYHDSLCFGMWRELSFSGKLLFKIVSLKEFNDALKLSVLLFDKVSLSFLSLHSLRLSFLIACSTIEIFRSSCFSQSFDISLQFKALITRSRLALPFPIIDSNYPDIDMIGNKELIFISMSNHCRFWLNALIYITLAIKNILIWVLKFSSILNFVAAASKHIPSQK